MGWRDDPNKFSGSSLHCISYGQHIEKVLRGFQFLQPLPFVVKIEWSVCQVTVHRRIGLSRWGGCRGAQCFTCVLRAKRITSADEYRRVAVVFGHIQIAISAIIKRGHFKSLYHCICAVHLVIVVPQNRLWDGTFAGYKNNKIPLALTLFVEVTIMTVVRCNSLRWKLWLHNNSYTTNSLQ